MKSHKTLRELHKLKIKFKEATNNKIYKQKYHYLILMT